jgi:transposase
MATRLVNIDRSTPMILPCDLRDWLPPDHIVHFILEAVEQLPLGAFAYNTRGTGSEQYPPGMMVALLIYCYATGRTGSRTIEAATYSDVAVRYVCGNTHPDHATICEFRTQNQGVFKAAFVRVLELAHELKVTAVGTVSVDGTKVAANASKHAAVSYERAGELIEQLELEVEQLLAQAKAADNQPREEGLKVAQELARRQNRQQALKQARAVIEERARERARAEREEFERKQQERRQREAQGRNMRGPKPEPPRSEPRSSDQYNFTDPESRIMKAGSGAHYEQAYNAQLAVDMNLLIVGQRVSQSPNDKEELAATVAAIEPVVQGEVKAVLTDSGFYSEAAVAQVEQSGQRTVYAAVSKESHHRSLAEILTPREPAPLPQGATPVERMRHRLQTQVGRGLYRLRKQTVEPVFGIIKEVMGFRRFRLRGRQKVALEWLLVCLSYNLKRLFVLRNEAAAG